jgi:hypothetical protein
MKHNVIAVVIVAAVIAIFLWIAPKPSGAPVGLLLPSKNSVSSISTDQVQIVQGNVPKNWLPAADIRLEMTLPDPNDRQEITTRMVAKIKSLAASYGCGVVEVNQSFVTNDFSPPVLHFTGTCYLQTVSS